MKAILINFLILFSSTAFSQLDVWPEDSLKEYKGKVVHIYTKDYLRLYNRMKKMVVKVYPYALYASDMIDEIDQNAEKIQRRRKKNKFYKESYKNLKDDFKYFILDLYTSEGKMLMKLIHRETGMTVYDISNKYRGDQKAKMFNLMAKIWDQDLHIEFDPSEGEDKVVEQVISDIQDGLVPFDTKIVTVDKLTYRDQQRKDKETRKKNKKQNKEYKKKKKKRDKERKKLNRKKKKKNPLQ